MKEEIMIDRKWVEGLFTRSKVLELMLKSANDGEVDIPLAVFENMAYLTGYINVMKKHINLENNE